VGKHKRERGTEDGKGVRGEKERGRRWEQEEYIDDKNDDKKDSKMKRKKMTTIHENMWCFGSDGNIFFVQHFDELKVLLTRTFKASQARNFR
jgi:hypothetical protein